MFYKRLECEMDERHHILRAYSGMEKGNILSIQVPESTKSFIVSFKEHNNLCTMDVIIKMA